MNCFSILLTLASFGQIISAQREGHVLCSTPFLECDDAGDENNCSGHSSCCINLYSKDRICMCHPKWTGHLCQYHLSFIENHEFEYEPSFSKKKDHPYNVSVTEGDSVTFNCSTLAMPEANVAWLQNGQPIDTNNPPERFVFSNDNTRLTIRSVCRNCTDRERKTDQMVIKCNASNVHGYTFASGYLNVINKTEVMIRGPDRVLVDFREQKHFIFQCVAISDLSTPPTVLWYKTEPYGDLVRDEPPYVCVSKEFLIVMVYPNCSSECAKYLGEYRCVGDNGYSRDNQTIRLDYKIQEESVVQKEEQWAVWKIIASAGTIIAVVMFLTGMFFGFRWKQIIGFINGRTKHKKLNNLPHMYERVDYAAVGVPLEETENNETSIPRASIMYEHTGYDTIDQVLEDMASREGVMPHPLAVSRQNSYESMDTPMIEAIHRGRAMMDSDTRYDDMGYAIPLEVTNRGEIDQHEVNGHDSIRCELILFPGVNEETEAMNTYSDLSRKDVDPYFAQLPAEISHNMNDLEEVSYRDRGIDEDQVNGCESVRSDSSESTKFPNSNEQSEEMNAYSSLNRDEVNSYLDLVKVPVPTEVDTYMDLCSKEVDPYLDVGQKEVDPYLDLCSKEVDPYLDLCSKEVDPYLDMGQKEVDPYLVMNSEEVNHNLDMDKKEVDQNVCKSLNPILGPTATLLEAD